MKLSFSVEVVLTLFIKIIWNAYENCDSPIIDDSNERFTSTQV